MQTWIYAGPGRRPNLTAMINLAALWQAGVINDNSTVWIDITADEPMMWALTHGRSSLLYVHRCHGPGYARITSDRIRWAPTYDGTGRNPQLDLDLNQLPGDHLTLVIAHRGADDTQLGLIRGSRRETMPTAGSYTADALTLIDLATYTPSTPAPTEAAARHALANATYYGPQLLTRSMNDNDSALFHDNPEAFAFDLDDSTMTLLCQHIATITQYAEQFKPVIAQRLQEGLKEASARPA